MSFFGILKETFARMNEINTYGRLNDEQLEAHKDMILDDLEEDPENQTLQIELDDVEAEQERRRQENSPSSSGGALVASRRIDFSKYSDEELDELVELMDTMPEDYRNKMTAKVGGTPGTPLKDFELDQITNDLFEEWGSRGEVEDKKLPPITPEEEEEIVKKVQSRDYTDPKNWNWWGYSIKELEELIARAKLNPASFREEFLIDEDEEGNKELSAALQSLQNTLKEIRNLEKEPVIPNESRILRELRYTRNYLGESASPKQVYIYRKHLFECRLASEILEGVVSAKEKYVNTDMISKPSFDQLVDIDPTNKKKYIDWIAKVFVENKMHPTDISKFGVLREFNTLLEKGKLPVDKRDINKYKTVEALYDEVKKYEGDVSTTQIKKEAKTSTKVVFENDLAAVYHPTTRESSCLYGKHTKWCTSGNKNNRFNDYFYEGNVNLYYVIPKVEGIDKIAIAVSPDGTIEIYDALDNQLSVPDANILLNKLGLKYGA